MSSDSQVAQLQDLLERVQRNRLRLAELRSARAPEPAAEEAPETAQTKPLPAAAAPVLPAPVPPAPLLPAPVQPAPVLPAPSEPAAKVIEYRPTPPAPAPPPAAAQRPIEPEPQLEPLPDEPAMVTSEPFAEAATTSPIPLVAAPEERPDLEPRRTPGKAVASGPVAEVTGSLAVQRSWSLDAVLFRAWRLGRGGSR